MNYLLDTHVFIWAISEREKLPAKVKLIIDDVNNSVYVSSISFWEIALKFSIGKLNIEGVLPDELPDLALKIGFRLIPLSTNESATYHQLPANTHKDPFDRMLIWQAIKGDYVLISKDDRITQYREVGLKTLW